MLKKTQGQMGGRKRMDFNNNVSTANQTKQKFNMTGMSGNVHGYSELDEEEEEREQARKIKPFSFDIDDDIDTEVLTNE